MDIARNWLKLLVLISVILATLCYGLEPPYYGIDRPSFDYELPPLEFGFSELEPFIDEETLRVHYLGHHSKYTRQMNLALNEWRVKVPELFNLISKFWVNLLVISCCGGKITWPNADTCKISLLAKGMPMKNELYFRAKISNVSNQNLYIILFLNQI